MAPRPPTPTSSRQKFYEVAPNFTLIGWLALTAPVVLSERRYQALAPDLRAAVDQAAMESAVFERNLVVEGEATLHAQAERAGAKMTDAGQGALPGRPRSHSTRASCRPMRTAGASPPVQGPDLRVDHHGQQLMAWRAAAVRRGLAMRDLAPAIGVEIGGVDLTAPEDAEITAILRAACVDRTLLLIRDQQAADHRPAIVDFTRRFGTQPRHPLAARTCASRVIRRSSSSAMWCEDGRAAGAVKVGMNWHTDHYHLE